MLRTFKPIKHDIFKLHDLLEHLVTRVWCDASNDHTCESLLDQDFGSIYRNYEWLRKEVDLVYDACKQLSAEERARIRNAFYVNNRIGELCDGRISPIPLSDLPAVVTDRMKPLLTRFYDHLLDRKKVPGSKLDYYNELIGQNGFATCPCCGIMPIESATSDYREDYDHYLPKAQYPFAVVNFRNLVPLCHKCNAKHKHTKNPFENGRQSYYPFNIHHQEIEVQIAIVDSDKLDYGKLEARDLCIKLTGEVNKTDTWDWLFNIRQRYLDQTRQFSKTELRVLKQRMEMEKKSGAGISYKDLLMREIRFYEYDRYADMKFLKIAFMKAIMNRPEWVAVYAVEQY